MIPFQLNAAANSLTRHVREANANPQIDYPILATTSLQSFQFRFNGNFVSSERLLQNSIERVKKRQDTTSPGSPSKGLRQWGWEFSRALTLLRYWNGVL